MIWDRHGGELLAFLTARLCSRADGTIYQEAPWIYLYFPTTFVAVSSRVQGYVFPSLYLGQDLAGVRVIPAGS